MSISKEDHDRIASAIRSVEAKTSGEIVCVLAKSSSQNTATPLFISAAIALAVPWSLMAFTAMTVQRILSLQVLVFLAILLFLSLPRIRVLLLPRKARRAIAHQAAMEQFITRGVARNKDRAGVLIFVSLEERYARIIAGDDIARHVPQSEWQTAVDALTRHMRDGRIADGFVSAINACGRVLAQHFPRSRKSDDKLPDRIYVI
jgi:putative membrane protein